MILTLYNLTDGPQLLVTDEVEICNPILWCAFPIVSSDGLEVKKENDNDDYYS